MPVRVISRHVMSAALEQVKLRAETAEQLMITVQNKITEIKRSYAESAAKDLERENDALKSEIKAIKKQLSYVEVRNGVPQIALPDGSISLTACTVPETSQLQTPADDIKPGLKSLKKEKKAAVKSKPKPGGDAEKPVDVSRLDMRVGLIESVERHPDADTLYVEKVNFGTGTLRTVLSGLVKHVPIEEMRNVKAIFVCNMKPAKMRGILSEGMILCASCPEKEEIISIPTDAEPGTRITLNEYPGEPDEMLPPKKKIWEQVLPDLKIDANGIANYKGAPFRINGKVCCKAPTLTNVIIK